MTGLLPGEWEAEDGRTFQGEGTTGTKSQRLECAGAFGEL